jgi:hypothetical protein
MRRLLVLFVLGALLCASVGYGQTAHAQTPSFGVTSSSTLPGKTGTLQVFAKDIEKPGLGAWSVDIAYDTNVITIVQCAATIQVSYCNPNYQPGVLRTAGASARGYIGDSAIAQIFFDCSRAGGETALDVTLVDVSDATTGGPVLIEGLDDVDGTVSCSDGAGGSGGNVDTTSSLTGLSVPMDPASAAIAPAPETSAPASAPQAVQLPAAGAGVTPTASNGMVAWGVLALLAAAILVGMGAVGHTLSPLAALAMRSPIKPAQRPVSPASESRVRGFAVTALVISAAAFATRIVTRRLK